MMTDTSDNRHPSRSVTRILIADDEQRILDEYAHVLGGSLPRQGESTALHDLEAELFGDDEAPGIDACHSTEASRFDVVMCRQGQDAVDAVQVALRENRPFSAAFLDVRMPPGIDGVATAARIRALDPLVNIVFVTGYSDIRPEQMGDRVPPLDKLIYCQKPLQASELRQFARALAAKWSAEQRVGAMQERLQQLLSSTSVIIYSRKPSGLHAATFVSANVLEQFGYPPAAFVDDERFWVGLVHPDDLPQWTANLQSLRQSGEITSEYRLRHADGEYRWVTDRVKLVRNGSGEPVELVGCFVDVSERRRSEEKILHMAYVDGLTGLPNRTFMRQMLDHALVRAARFRHRVVVLYLDIDHFKRINDTLGHDAGDVLLREVAQRLQEQVRGSDQVSRQTIALSPQSISGQTVSRLGGDEFVVILTEVANADAAACVAQRIADSLSVPVRLAHHEVTVSASIGISVYPEDGENAEKLLKHADTAMYCAKQLGRNRFQFFTKELTERAARRFSLESKMRKALEQGAFLLHYQPKQSLKSNCIIGMEALLRWRQPDAGLISPAEFIPIAEEIGLIVPIGEWVVHEACRQAAAWRAAGLPALTVSVNLSAAQFKQRRLVQNIRRALDLTKLDSSCLEIELTESILVEDTEASTVLLAQLKDLGVRLSIDDFGTGYSSLSYLKRFALDALKIDRSFVRDLTTDSNDAAIVSATIALAHNLRLGVVAEGVETQLQAEILREQGCDEAQGFLFSRPLPADDFFAWVMQRAAAA
jgi:PAS domain S-box-containing protein